MVSDSYLQRCSPHQRLEIGVTQSEQTQGFIEPPHYHHLAVADVELSLRIVAKKLVDIMLWCHDDPILTGIGSGLLATLKQSWARYRNRFDGSEVEDVSDVNAFPGDKAGDKFIMRGDVI